MKADTLSINIYDDIVVLDEEEIDPEITVKPDDDVIAEIILKIMREHGCISSSKIKRIINMEYPDIIVGIKKILDILRTLRRDGKVIQKARKGYCINE